MNTSFDWIKQQLVDYYQKRNDYALSLAEEAIVINRVSGIISKELIIPIGLRDELGFIEEEILMWQRITGGTPQ